MLWRMLRQSWFRNLRRKSLAVLTVFLAAGLISALLAVSIDIGDKMARELKSYGANILIEPAGQAVLPAQRTAVGSGSD
jgi:putative ABC transport system permease protein